jgi:hypothetical protein
MQQYGYCQRARGDPPHIPLYYPHAECTASVAPPLQRPPARTTVFRSSRTGLSIAGGHARASFGWRLHPLWGEARIFSSGPRMTLDPRQAAVWSARDHGENFVNLAGPFEPSVPKEEEDD